MAANYNLKWDVSGERFYETGVQNAALYLLENNAYTNGVAWNGLTGVDENPDGADVTDIWADNIKYASFRSKENHKGTIKAYMFPDEFKACNGMASPTDMKGLTFGQQARKAFGLCYRTEIGSDNNPEAGYKLHLVYNNTVSPSSTSYATTNENPDAVEFSWEYSSTPVEVEGVAGVKTTSTIEINSLDFTEAQMEALLTVLYGTDSTKGRMPLPGEVYTILKGAA